MELYFLNHVLISISEKGIKVKFFTLYFYLSHFMVASIHLIKFKRMPFGKRPLLKKKVETELKFPINLKVC